MQDQYTMRDVKPTKNELNRLTIYTNIAIHDHTAATKIQLYYLFTWMVRKNHCFIQLLKIALNILFYLAVPRVDNRLKTP